MANSEKDTNESNPIGQEEKQKERRKKSSGQTPWWVYFTIFLLIVLITGAFWMIVFSNRSGLAAESGPTPKPLFVIITSTPTQKSANNENTIVGTPSPTALNLPDETPDTDLGRFLLGEEVVISGTEGSGLSIRANPGIDGEVVSVGFDGETFEIVDGPVSAVEYSWWFIRDITDPAREGWVVEDFITQNE